MSFKGVWINIEGYENMYQISNTGKIKSLSRKGVRKDRIRVLAIDKYGYSYVSLIKNKIREKYMIHRLVAIHFIPNIYNSPQVNHKDGIKTNNNTYNLEWCTISENVSHAYKFLNKKPNLTGTGKFGKLNHNAKQINQYSITGEFIKTWDCILDITKEYKICRKSIWGCCINKYKTSHGFKWEYYK
jgi:hypothetical protein